MHERRDETGFYHRKILRLGPNLLFTFQVMEY
jgi:hypothetical protein